MSSVYDPHGVTAPFVFPAKTTAPGFNPGEARMAILVGGSPQVARILL